MSKIVALAEGADLLFIEGGFLQADAASRAAPTPHSVPVGTIARLVGVKRLQTCTTRHATRTRATGLRRRPKPLPAPPFSAYSKQPPNQGELAG
ncbi:MAG TPA: hypothetical protein VFZ16_05005 [Hyphomicrobiaceae bacterium]|nr:hypothetical protein [Hyphomicrobiaceae bacterium]